MDREEFRGMSGADYIRAMFENTREGKLVLEDENDAKTYYMDWTKEAAEEAVTRFEKLLAELTRLGEDHTKWMESTQDMPEDLLEVWNTYILPYPDHGMDLEELQDASIKAELDEPLTEREKELLDAQRLWMHMEALRRMPYCRCNPAYMIQRARRYEKLVSLHAPKIVIDNEARYLAEELALYYYLAA